MGLWADAVAVAAKDLRIEAHSRVGVGHVVPFALVLLMVFAFAFGPDSSALPGAAPGLYWVSVLFSAMLGAQRSFAIEAEDAAGEGMILAGLDPAGIVLGKAAALAVQLLALEALLAGGIAILYNVQLRSLAVLAGSALVATAGIACTSTLYAALSSGSSAKESMLPLLSLPVLAPVVLAATKAWSYGLAGHPSFSGPWLELLGLFTIVYVSLGAAVAGPLLEVS